MSKIVLKYDRRCKHCNANETRIWHRDRWGRIGWYCHLCYTCIDYIEKKIVCMYKKRPTPKPGRVCMSCGSDYNCGWWHRDKWTGRNVGWYCHTCYESIGYRKERGFLGQ